MLKLRSPFDGNPLRRRHAETLAGVLAAVADPARLQILSSLHRASAGLSVAEIHNELGRLSQPTVSHHLGILVTAGLVSKEKVGVFQIHRLEPGVVEVVADLLNPAGSR